MIRFFGRPKVIAAAIIISSALASIAIVLGGIALVRLGEQQNRITSVVGSIQDERVRNTRDSCERSNVQNAAIVMFIQHTGVADGFVGRATHAFPQRDCAQVTRQQTGASTSKSP